MKEPHFSSVFHTNQDFKDPRGRSSPLLQRKRKYEKKITTRNNRTKTEKTRRSMGQKITRYCQKRD